VATLVYALTVGPVVHVLMPRLAVPDRAGAESA
jgi:hypothetical protein